MVNENDIETMLKPIDGLDKSSRGFQIYTANWNEITSDVRLQLKRRIRMHFLLLNLFLFRWIENLW